MYNKKTKKTQAQPLFNTYLPLKSGYFAFLLLTWCFSLHAQQPPKPSPEEKTQQKTAALNKDEEALKLGMKDFNDAPRNNKGVRLVFYNVENLFDIFDDSLKQDEEFLPTGAKGWSYNRYREKQNHIYKTMMAVGGFDPPEIIGFCEIENRFVLTDLIDKTPFKKFGYGVVHEESPDNRGVDVGMIYRKERFKPLQHEAMRVVFPFDPDAKTRDVLYVKGLALGKDTLHVFVNHWPSRRGGQAKSEPRRMYVAGMIRQKVDSIFAASPNANIVIMGDLNDEASDKSIVEGLRAKLDLSEVKAATDLFDYMHALGKNWQLGSHKYQSHWGTLDHIVVSAPLLQNRRKGRFYADPAGAKIFAARFLLEEDRQFMGLKPYRTYAGPRHIGGFSDHLPVYLDLWLSE